MSSDDNSLCTAKEATFEKSQPRGSVAASFRLNTQSILQTKVTTFRQLTAMNADVKHYVSEKKGLLGFSCLPIVKNFLSASDKLWSMHRVWMEQWGCSSFLSVYTADVVFDSIITQPYVLYMTITILHFLLLQIMAFLLYDENRSLELWQM